MMTDIPNPLDLLGKFDPFGAAGDLAGKVAADGWTGIMLSIWSAGLWVLRFVLGMMDAWLTPDISSRGPAAAVYRTTFWAAGALVLIMVLVQLGVAGFRRDGKSLARVVIGAAQFIMVWAAWITYGIAVLAACGGLTKALMNGLLKIDAWSQWNPMPDFDFANSSIEVALATVLGFLGLFLWIAAIGHFVVMLTRAAALLILAAVTPIAAAGLVSEAGRSWFWKSLRWFHAAALTPVLSVLVMGLGIKLTGGVAHGQTASSQAAVGTALPGVMLILISLVAPVALFRLLAFVDPGTSSGAAMRAGMASAGGLHGLLSGGSGAQQSGSSSAASTSSGSGQSQGEAQSNAATATRFGAALGVVGKGVGMVANAGAKAATVGIDDMNQTAVGDASYYPDYQRGAQNFNPDQRDSQGNDGAAGGGDDGTPAPTGSVPMPNASQTGLGSHGTPSPPGGTRASGSSGSSAAAAGEVPPVA